METLKERQYVPALPTLWPNMLRGGRRSTGDFLPFSAASARWFYFARNAVWTTVKMLGLDQGEVLVPAYHHGVEIEALIDAGTKVRFYRVGPKWDVDLEDVERKIGPRTKALYLVHYAGFPGPAEEMKRIADKHGIPLIEDCALSLLAADGTRPLGSTGDVSIFCLYKTLPVPHGGAMVINGSKPYAVPEPPAPPVASTLNYVLNSLLENIELRGGDAGRWLRSSVRAMGRRTVRAAKIDRVATGTQHFNRDHVDLGMSPVVHRIIRAQDLAGVVEARRRNYFYLMSRLRDLSTPLFSQLAPGACPLFFPLVVEDKAPLMAALAERGIETIDFWRYFHPACDASAFPEVATLRRTILEIPCHQDLDAERIAFVASAVRTALIDQRQRSTPPQLRTSGS